LVSSSVTANRNGPGCGRGYVACQCSSAIAVLAKGPVGLVLPGHGCCGVSAACRGSLWVVLRPMPMLAMACFSLLWPTPCYALAAQAHGMAFLVVFSVSAIWSVNNLRAFGTATPALVTSIVPWCPAAAACHLVRSIGPGRLQASAMALLNWAGGASSPELQLGLRFCLVWFLVVLFCSSPPPPLNWLATSCAGASGALLISLYWESPCAGHRQGHWP